MATSFPTSTSGAIKLLRIGSRLLSVGLTGLLLSALLVPQEGCSGGHEVCIYNGDSCSVFTSESMCPSVYATGCLWQLACREIPCDGTDEAACAAIAGCNWNSTPPVSCERTSAPVVCNSLETEQTCAAEISCSWGMACRFNPKVQCSQATSQMDCEHIGACRWTDTGNPSLG